MLDNLGIHNELIDQAGSLEWGQGRHGCIGVTNSEEFLSILSPRLVWFWESRPLGAPAWPLRSKRASTLGQREGRVRLCHRQLGEGKKVLQGPGKLANISLPHGALGPARLACLLPGCCLVGGRRRRDFPG